MQSKEAENQTLQSFLSLPETISDSKGTEEIESLYESARKSKFSDI